MKSPYGAMLGPNTDLSCWQIGHLTSVAAKSAFRKEVHIVGPCITAIPVTMQLSPWTTEQILRCLGESPANHNFC